MSTLKILAVRTYRWFTMYSTRTVVRVPAGLGMGMLIGKQGSNIKYLQSRTAARMAVNADTETVTIIGNKEDVSLALMLMEAQFASWRSSGEPSVHT